MASPAQNHYLVKATHVSEYAILDNVLRELIFALNPVKNTEVVDILAIKLVIRVNVPTQYVVPRCDYLVNVGIEVLV